MADVFHYWWCFLQCVTASGVAASMAGAEAVAVWKMRRRARLCSDLDVYKMLQL